MNFEYQQAIQRRIDSHSYLVALFGSLFSIPERLYEYNPELFICFNKKTEQHEIHSLGNPEGTSTMCAVLPFKGELDARTIRYVWENDIRVHGKEIFRRIERGEEKQKKKADRDFKNWVEDVAKETQSMLAKDAWTTAT